jgi:hypothetical protein
MNILCVFTTGPRPYLFWGRSEMGWATFRKDPGGVFLILGGLRLVGRHPGQTLTTFTFFMFFTGALCYFTVGPRLYFLFGAV